MAVTRPKEESPVMAQGYEHYLSLGVNRSLEAVAQLVSRPVRTVQQWAKDWNWEGRYQQHIQVYGETPNNQEFAPDEILQRFPITEGGAAMTKHEYRSVLGSLVRDFVDRFRLGDVQIRNIADFEKIVKLDLLLMGEATSRNDNVGTQEHTVKVEHIIENNPLARDLIATMWRDYTNPNLMQGIQKLEGLTAQSIIIDDPLAISDRIITPLNPKLQPIVKSPVNTKDIIDGEVI